MMTAPLTLVLTLAAILGAAITLRFAATFLPARHRLRRAADAVDAPLWRIRAADPDRMPHAPPPAGGTGGGCPD
jgi:hypothetical protein